MILHYTIGAPCTGKSTLKRELIEKGELVGEDDDARTDEMERVLKPLRRAGRWSEHNPIWHKAYLSLIDQVMDQALKEGRDLHWFSHSADALFHVLTDPRARRFKVDLQLLEVEPEVQEKRCIERDGKFPAFMKDSLYFSRTTYEYAKQLLTVRDQCAR